MGLVSSVIPNLIGGVSQQAPAARPRNTSKYELNTNHSVVSGLIQRPATDWIAELHASSDTTKGASSHAFETANGKRHILVLDDDGTDTRCTIIDPSDGSKQILSLTGVAGYFATLPADFSKGFKYVTVGDTTFILNKSISPTEIPSQEDPDEVVDTTYSVATYGALPSASAQSLGATAHVTGTDTYYTIVAQYVDWDDYGRGPQTLVWTVFAPALTNTRFAPARRGTMYIRQAVHSTNYSVVVTLADASVVTGTYTSPEPVDGAGDPVTIDTGTIVDGLLSSINGVGGITATRIGSTLALVASQNITKIEARDEFGDQASRAFSEAVQDFSDLPPNEVEGRVVRISGSVDTGQDDYFVEYVDGLWRETVAFGAKTTVDASTMPIVVTYDPVADTFAITYHTWPGRNSGDTVSNPVPTFIGRTIADMFLFKSRMFFLSDENVICSEVGNYENFYRTTLTQYLETDPIDVASSAARTSFLKHGVAFDETLVLFSGSQQFRLLSGSALTPQNIGIVPTTTYNASVSCSPIAVGPNVFFVEDSESAQYARVMEYFRNPNSERDDAAAVTASVPKYIPGNILKITSAFNENIVAVLPKDNTGSLYIHKYFWSGAEKALSSWTEWKFKNVLKILSADFFGDVLYLVVEDSNNNIQLMSCNVEEGRYDTDLGYMLHLDCRVDDSAITIAYDGGTDLTSYTLPFSIDVADDPVLIITETTGEYPVGAALDIDNFTATVIYATGDTSAVPVMFGINFDMIYDFSTIFVRTRSGNGEIVQQNGRLSLRHMKLRFDGTSYFDVEVTPEGRATWSKSHPGDFYTAIILQSGGGLPDLAPVQAGDFRFSCKGKSDAMDIRIINRTPYPCAFTQAEWEAQYSPKTRFI